MCGSELYNRQENLQGEYEFDLSDINGYADDSDCDKIFCVIMTGTKLLNY